MEEDDYEADDLGCDSDCDTKVDWWGSNEIGW